MTNDDTKTPEGSAADHAVDEIAPAIVFLHPLRTLKPRGSKTGLFAPVDLKTKTPGVSTAHYAVDEIAPAIMFFIHCED